MYLKIGDLKLSQIKVMQDGELIYEGMVEDAPAEIKEKNYKTATFESQFIVLDI